MSNRFKFNRIKLTARRKSVWSVLFGLVVVSLSLLILVADPGITAALKKNYSLATTHQPEGFTVLYFKNHRQLMYDCADKIPQTNTFVLTNNEFKTINYRYLVTYTYLGKSTVLRTGSVQLGNQQSTSIAFHYTCAFPVEPILIKVTLINRPESIYFWVDP